MAATSRNSMATIDTHPQRSKIIEMLADTKRTWSNREISATLDPPVSYATICRYRQKMLGASTKLMKGRSENTAPLKDLGAIVRREATHDSVAMQQRAKLQQELEEASEERRLWLQDAQNQLVIGPDGKPVLDPETKKPITRMDHRALASHDRNRQTSIELRAKMDGVLVPETSNVQVTAVIVMPAAQPAQVINANSAGSQVIDVDAAEIDGSR